MENVYQWVILLSAIVGLVTALVAMVIKFVAIAKQLKGKVKIDDILEAIPSIITICEDTSQTGAVKLEMALCEVEKLCQEKGVAFDKEFWVCTINNMIDMSKKVNVKVVEIKAKKQSGITSK